MKVVVDTNIVFSAILNTTGKIGDLLFNSGESFVFYTCEYLKTELIRHKGKLLKATKKMTEDQLETTISLVLNQIRFINESLIAKTTWLEAEKLVADVDIDDVEFVALTQQLNAVLWTGDKPLYVGLRAK